MKLETIADVATAFVADLESNGFTSSAFTSSIVSPTTAAGKPSSEPVRDVPETIAQMKSLSHQATKLGLGPGATVMMKQGGADIFIVKSVSDEHGVVLGKQGLPDVTITVDTFLATYKVHKGKMEEVLQHLEVGVSDQSEAWGWDIVKGLIGQASS